MLHSALPHILIIYRNKLNNLIRISQSLYSLARYSYIHKYARHSIFLTIFLYHISSPKSRKQRRKPQTSLSTPLSCTPSATYPTTSLGHATKARFHGYHKLKRSKRTLHPSPHSTPIRRRRRLRNQRKQNSYCKLLVDELVTQTKKDTILEFIQSLDFSALDIYKLRSPISSNVN